MLDSKDRPETIEYGSEPDKKRGKEAKMKLVERKGTGNMGPENNPGDNGNTGAVKRGTGQKETGANPGENGNSGGEVEEEKKEKPQLTRLAAIIVLLIATALIAVSAEFLVSSIDGVATKSHMSKEFIGLVLLPIVGNVAEHWTAVSAASKDMVTLSVSVAIGSSIVSFSPFPARQGQLTPIQQIALFVIPMSVQVGWWIKRPLTLAFDPFESTMLFFAFQMVAWTMNDGKSNWLEGGVLISACVQPLFL